MFLINYHGDRSSWWRACFASSLVCSATAASWTITPATKSVNSTLNGIQCRGAAAITGFTHGGKFNYEVQLELDLCELIVPLATKISFPHR